MGENKLLEQALQDKLHTAEKRLSLLRFVLIAFNSLIYLLFLPHENMVWLAYGVIIVANLYSLFSLVFEPYKKFPFLSSIHFTTISDSTLIVLWIMATGFMDSPFYIIWYVSLIAVAYRYTVKETGVSTVAYVACYLLIYLIDTENSTPTGVLLTRLGYLPLAGMLGMYFSTEISEQIDGKIRIIKGEQALKDAHDTLEKKVEQRTKELSIINKDLTDSLSYAERIQSAILPTSKDLMMLFKDSFVIHLPRDIVSGDFYWTFQHEQLTFVAVVDCTGHGVPGALMSMIGNNLLERTVVEKRIHDPAEILRRIDKDLAELVKNRSDRSTINDGMDISICCIDREANVLRFGGAQGYAIVVRNGQVMELQSSKFSIGGMLSGPEKPFITIETSFEDADTLYMFTDGYQDQFGGPVGKKFYRKNLMALLSDISHRPMASQRSEILGTFKTWKGDEMQMDDVTVVGIRL